MTVPSLASRVIPLGLLTLFLLGCADEPTQPAPRTTRLTGPYFDVRGLVERQMQALGQRPVTKQVVLRDGSPGTVRVPAVKWADELQVFLQADINKAALRGAYAVDSVVDGGRVLRTYTRKAALPNAPVTQLRVLQEGAEPREINAVITQSNPLFTSSKQLQMQFQNGLLRHYEVKGTQKLILFDTLRYSTAATVE